MVCFVWCVLSIYIQSDSGHNTNWKVINSSKLCHKTSDLRVSNERCVCQHEREESVTLQSAKWPSTKTPLKEMYWFIKSTGSEHISLSNNIFTSFHSTTVLSTLIIATLFIVNITFITHQYIYMKKYWILKRLRPFHYKHALLSVIHFKSLPNLFTFLPTHTSHFS